jgi:hypothetical protein
MTCLAWLPAPQVLDGAMLPGHLSQGYPAELWPFLERMRMEDITTVAARAFAGGRGETYECITHDV